MLTLLSVFGFFKNLLSDWRSLLIIVVIVIAGALAWKYRTLNKEIRKKETALQIEKQNNETLRGNVTTLKEVNAQNAQVIEQMQKDKEAATAAINTLAARVEANNIKLVYGQISMS